MNGRQQKTKKTNATKKNAKQYFLQKAYQCFLSLAALLPTPLIGRVQKRTSLEVSKATQFFFLMSSSPSLIFFFHVVQFELTLHWFFSFIFVLFFGFVRL